MPCIYGITICTKHWMQVSYCIFGIAVVGCIFVGVDNCKKNLLRVVHVVKNTYVTG